VAAVAVAAPTAGEYTASAPAGEPPHLPSARATSPGRQRHRAADALKSALASWQRQVRLRLSAAAPGGQLVQLRSPAAGLYFPAAHGAHGPPPGPVFPASHSHAATAMLPAAERERGGHGPHASDPSEGLKVPVGHMPQGYPSGPEKPGGHTQLDREVAPWDEVDERGQARQAAAEEAASVVEYLPASQSWQSELPSSSL